MEVVNHIVIIENQARIRGKEHLKAEMVARMYVDTDYTIKDVMEQYNLSAAEVHSAIAYYYDHRDALDAEYDRVVAEIHENAMNLEKFKAKLAASNNPQKTD